MKSIFIKIFIFILITSCRVNVEKKVEGSLTEKQLADRDLNTPCPDTSFNSLDYQYQLQLIKMLGAKSLDIYKIESDDSSLVESLNYSNGIPQTESKYRDNNLRYFFTYESDSKENITKRTSYNSDSTYVGDLIYKYDDKDNRIESYQILENGDITNRQIRVYNDLNQNIELYNNRNGVKYLAITFEYCSKGVTNGIKYFDEEGNLRYHSKINLDEFGNHLQTVSTYPDGQVDIGNITSYRYDDKNNIIMKSTGKVLVMTMEDQESTIDLFNNTSYGYYPTGLLKHEIAVKNGDLEEELVYHYRY